MSVKCKWSGVEEWETSSQNQVISGSIFTFCLLAIQAGIYAKNQDATIYLLKVAREDVELFDQPL